MTIERIGDNVVHLPDVLGGPSFVLGDDELTLVDTGLEGAGEEILAALQSLGRRPDELTRILITHADRDHVGGLAEVVAATGARVYAPGGEADVVEGKTASRAGDTKEWGRVDERVEPGTTLSFHGGIDVIDTHGHTHGHVAYLLRDGGVLFAGDCVNNTEGLVRSPARITADEQGADEAVRTIAALRPTSVCFGHGPSLVGDAAEQLDALAASL
jgi:glyoxylase-like metal-dependent hydrolase (beta-lactamase superfamily II)